MVRKKTLFYLLSIIGFALFGVKALFHPGYYTSHDGWHQVARLTHFDQAVKDGHFPPRWAGGLLYGTGYPLFVFNYHLPWYLAEPLVSVGFSIFDAIKATFILGFLLSGVIMFLWTREMWGDKGGFLSAILYLWAPYRFSNIFVRASLGEATGFIFLPLLFWSTYRLSRHLNRRFIVIGAASLAGLILSHAMVVYLVFLPALFFFLSFLPQVKEKRAYLLSNLLSVVIGLLLSAYYILPAISYQGLTVFKEAMKGYYRDHFVFLSKLIYSRWGYGFSGIEPDAMSMQLGIVHWLVVVLTVFLLIFSWRLKFIKKVGQVGEIRAVMALFIGFVFSIFMMLKSSLPIWQLFEGVVIIDFPWRFLGISVFLASILSGWLVKIISQSMPSKIRLGGVKIVALPAPEVVSSLLVVSLAAVALYTNRNHLRVNQYTNIPLSLYIASEQTSNTNDEYLPIWADREYLKKEGRPFLLTKEGEVFHNFKLEKDTTVEKIFSYSTDRNEKLSVNLLYFPGWIAKIDGINTRLASDRRGLILLNAPAGRHHVVLKFLDTWPVGVGKIISLLGVGVVMLFAFLGKLRSHPT